jgi:hypothetical protein
VTQLRGSLAVYTVASLLVTGIADALDLAGAEPLNRACVVPGEIAWDDCQCGTLAITARRFFLSDEFPQGALGQALIRASPCDLPWLVAELAIQVIRCAPTPTGTALSPSCEQLATAAQVLLVDQYVTLTTTVAILCDLRTSDSIIDYVLGEQTSVGPEGECVGTELVALVGFQR